MQRDIFSTYLQEMASGSKSGGEILRDRTPSHDNEANFEQLTVLREISAKLDNLKPQESCSPPAGAELMDLAIIGGNVVIPDNGVFKLNVYVKDGKIASIGNDNSIKAKRIIDAWGKYVLPGIIDPHTHMGINAPMETELSTETKSALMGGVTTMGCFFGGEQSHFSSFPKIQQDISRLSYTDFIPHLVIGNNEQMKEIPDYVQHLGITSFKLYMNGIPGIVPDVDDGFIMDVFEKIKQAAKPCIVCAHAENRYLVRRAYQMTKDDKGADATVLDWADTHPEMAEEEAVMRLSYLAEKSDVSVYFVHMSTKAAIERLRSIKPNNKQIHVETTSPYLAINSKSISGNLYKMEPPFREPQDTEALWQAVNDGIIDTIGTDNVTITTTEKRAGPTIWETIPGYPAVETHLASMLNEGVIRRGIPIERIVSCMTKHPAQTFGVYPQKGTLLPGSDADIVIVDFGVTKEVRASQLHSRSDFSLFDGRSLQGWPIMTIKSGVVAAEDGRLTEQQPMGRVLSR